MKIKETEIRFCSGYYQLPHWKVYYKAGLWPFWRVYKSMENRLGNSPMPMTYGTYDEALEAATTLMEDN